MKMINRSVQLRWQNDVRWTHDDALLSRQYHFDVDCASMSAFINEDSYIKVGTY